MRKLTKILLLILLALVYYYSYVSYLWHSENIEQKRKEEHRWSHMPEEIRLIRELCKNSKLEPMAEEPWQDYWKAPYETEQDGGGDCEDLSVWFLYELNKLGYDAWPVIGLNDYAGHMWVRTRVLTSIEMRSEYYDIDMVEKTIEKAWQEIPFEERYALKLNEAMERQRKHEQGE